MSGFSIAETFAILTGMSMLAGVATPSIDGYLLQARSVKAASDTRTIAIALVRLFDDTATEKHNIGAWATYELLVSTGGTPALGKGGDSRWLGSIEEQHVGPLIEHLVTNHVGYTVARERRTHIARGWRGSYLDGSVSADPWGNRYAVNMAMLATRTSDIVVLSAGPNGLIETPYETDGIIPGGDDVLALLSSGR